MKSTSIICCDYSKGTLTIWISVIWVLLSYDTQKSTEQVDRIFASGYEKIGLHTIFNNGSSLISQVAAKYVARQSVLY